MIPGRARMLAALATAPSFHENRVAIWSQPAMGLDFSAARRIAANTIFFASTADIDAGLLSRPVVLRDVDFHTAKSADCRCEVEFEVYVDGCCHGLLGWFDMKLGGDWLSTGPEAEPMHWSAAFLPLDPPLDFSAGDVVKVKLDRPEFGEWSWTVSRGGERQCHSTFHSNLVDLAYLKKMQPDMVPGVGNKGELARLTLGLMAEGKTVSEIVACARDRFTLVAERDPLFERRIRNLMAEYGADPRK